MASKSANVDFRALLTSVNRGEFAPVYILMGEESYYIDRLTEALEEKVVTPEERDFNLMTFYGPDADFVTVLSACQQYPFMADRKIVFLKEAQGMTNAKNTLDKFAEYVMHPNPQNVFVITYKNGSLSATSKLLKAASKSGAVIMKSDRLREWDLPAPIKDYCRARKVGIQDKAVAILIDHVGNSLAKLFGEIDKLLIAAGGKASQITPELIETHIGISKEFNNYELQAALAVKDYDKCMRIVKAFSSNPKANPTVMTTAVLFGFFSRLVLGHMSSDKSDNGLIAAMGLRNAYALREMKQGLSHYTVMQSIRAIHLIREFDTKSKGIESTQNEYSLLIELIYNLFTARP